MLEKYQVNEDTSKFKSVYDTSLRYFAELGNNCISCHGLHNDPGTILIDRKPVFDWDYYVFDTFHDYCLFFTSPCNSKDSTEGTYKFYQDSVNELAADLRKLGFEPPEEKDIYHVFGASYPGSRGFAMEYNGKLVFL